MITPQPGMIVGSKYPLPIGSRHDAIGVIDKDGVRHDIPFIVIRKSSLGEWIEYAKSEDVPDSHIRATIAKTKLFYEISID